MLARHAPPIPRSVLSLDIGQRRIGLAGCDPLGITVKPLQPLQRSLFHLDLARIGEVCSKRIIHGLVIGLPLDKNGNITCQAYHCQRNGLRLARALGIPLAMVNEHGSSLEAAALHGLYGDRSGRLDSAAAALILEQWLREGPELELIRSGKLAKFLEAGDHNNQHRAGYQS